MYLMKLASLVFLPICMILSLPTFAQLDVQVGAGGLFSNLSEVYSNGPGPGVNTTGDPSFRPYLSGLVGVSFSEKWGIRSRIVGTSRAETNINGGISGVEPSTFSAYYLDLGVEVQWKPIPTLGFSVGPYYAFDLYEQIEIQGVTRNFDFRFYDDFLAIKPAVEAYFGPFVARLDASIGLTPVSRLMYTDSNGQPIGDARRYWNGASIGFSYRLTKA